MNYHREFEKTIRAASRRHHTWQVFSDFCEMAAISLANAVTFGPARDKREARYLELAKRYDRDELNSITQLLGITTMALEGYDTDFLGEMFMSLELSSHWHGQFFTPIALTKAMGEITIGETAEAVIEERGFVTVSDPACGAAGMVLGLAYAMQARKINYQQHLHATCVDIDSTAAHMAFIQLSLLHVPAVVIIGNTLSMEMREAWYTPAHIMGLWDSKLARGYAMGSRADEAALPAPEPLNLQDLKQADMFVGEEAA
ncbi:N-6 DNA methylase [Marinobacter sp.]|uniref:N-6 DNA methylase n=1 Tax=Marinobacter sp. TaxID=50741 RepID=UPI0035C728B1